MSCTNEFEEYKALNCLYRFLENHPDYSDLIQRSAESVLSPHALIGIFEAALERNFKDQKLHQAVAVLFFMTRNF